MELRRREFARTGAGAAALAGFSRMLAGEPIGRGRFGILVGFAAGSARKPE